MKKSKRTKQQQDDALARHLKKLREGFEGVTRYSHMLSASQLLVIRQMHYELGNIVFQRHMSDWQSARAIARDRLRDISN